MKTILVVEDDKLLGKTICAYLDKAGFEVFWSHSANEAYEALRERDVDLILLDIMMPEIDGYQVLKELRASKNWKDIPVVVLTNLSGSRDMERAMNLGAMDFIIKSNVDLNALVEKINKEYLV